nr:hypothetical protein GCM10020092_021310 [Actinoplanes digitatis]
MLFPGIGPAVGSARRATKWGPTLVGLNDGRGSDVKIGLIGSENLGLWAVLRCWLGQSDHGPRPGWCADLPLGPLGAEGIRAGAVTISAIEDVKPADVAPLLLAEPAVGAETRLLLRVDVPGRSGVVAVDAGDGVWQRRIFFTLLHPARRGAQPPRDVPGGLPGVRPPPARAVPRLRRLFGLWLAAHPALTGLVERPVSTLRYP